MILEKELSQMELSLKVLKELHYLTELTPELQEEEKKQIIQEFRIRIIDKLLSKCRYITEKLDE